MSALASPPGLFFGVQNLVIPNGKFVQVGRDHHVYGDVSTQIDNTSTATSAAPLDGHQVDPSWKAQSVAATYVVGDQHIHGDYHVHYHYHGISNEDSDAVRICKVTGVVSHYHVYKGQDIVFCTQFSDIYTSRGFPLCPSLIDMEKYARIILERIDKAMPGYPWWTTGRSYPEPFNFEPPDRFNSTPYKVSGMPDFDYEAFKKDRERLYTLPCMQISQPDTAQEPLFTPRSALFSHLDRSGVK